MWRHLKGMILYGTDRHCATFYDVLLAQISNQLLSIHVDAPISVPPKTFGSLREICIFDPNASKIKTLRTNALMLQRVHLHFVAANIRSQQQIEKLINELVMLLEMPTLESISIRMDNDIPAIKLALRRVKFPFRQRMRCTMYISNMIQDVKDYLDLFTTALLSSCLHYCIRFRCIMTQRLYEALKSEQSDFGCNPGKVYRLCRQNEGCILQGTRPNWLVPCVSNE